MNQYQTNPLINLAKKIFFIIIIFSSCKTGAYYKSPNDFNKTEVIVYMKDGSVKKGLLSVLNEDQSGLFAASITFIPEGEKKSEPLNLNNIKSYELNREVYVLKSINLFKNGQPHLIFVKRLTDENAKMQLFEIKQDDETGEKFDYYFVSMPSFAPYEVTAINSAGSIKLLETDLKEILTNCTALSTKMLTKQPGYYYDLTTFQDKKFEVISRIAKEYNQCPMQQNTVQ